MNLSPLAGKPAPREVLVDVDALIAAYYERQPDPARAEERVSFGTSGHRGSSLASAFNEAHILATTQAICEYRKAQGIGSRLSDPSARVSPARRPSACSSACWTFAAPTT